MSFNCTDALNLPWPMQLLEVLLLPNTLLDGSC